MSISRKTRTIIKVLLICGIIAPLLRVITDLVSAMWYPGYSLRDQSMSQLADFFEGAKILESDIWYSHVIIGMSDPLVLQQFY